MSEDVYFGLAHTALSGEQTACPSHGLFSVLLCSVLFCCNPVLTFSLAPCLLAGVVTYFKFILEDSMQSKADKYWNYCGDCLFLLRNLAVSSVDTHREIAYYVFVLVRYPTSTSI